MFTWKQYGLTSNSFESERTSVERKTHEVSGT